MRNLLWKLLSVAVLTIGVLMLIVLPAQAQGDCVPFSGTIYFWYTDAWHGVGDFTIGRNIHHADVLSVNTSFFDGGNVWRGTEQWTLDFGIGDTIQLKMDFVTEHMNDAVASSGVFHLIEVGIFANGTGVFKNAYGNLSVQGPFGPNVKLPDNIQPPSDAQTFSVAPSHGMICGLNNRH
jgi:hypothetical protein